MTLYLGSLYGFTVEGSLLVLRDNEVVSLDSEDGALKWTSALPAMYVCALALPSHYLNKFSSSDSNDKYARNVNFHALSLTTTGVHAVGTAFTSHLEVCALTLILLS